MNQAACLGNCKLMNWHKLKVWVQSIHTNTHICVPQHFNIGQTEIHTFIYVKTHFMFYVCCFLNISSIMKWQLWNMCLCLCVPMCARMQWHHSNLSTTGLIAYVVNGKSLNVTSSKCKRRAEYLSCFATSALWANKNTFDCGTVDSSEGWCVGGGVWWTVVQMRRADAAESLGQGEM